MYYNIIFNKCIKCNDINMEYNIILNKCICVNDTYYNY